MGPSRSPTVLSVWVTTARKECRWKKSAGVGLWRRRKAEKSKNRLSRLAWKSRKPRRIPTFPPPRLRLAIDRNRTFHLLPKPDILICYQHQRFYRQMPLLKNLHKGLKKKVESYPVFADSTPASAVSANSRELTTAYAFAQLSFTLAQRSEHAKQGRREWP